MNIFSELYVKHLARVLFFISIGVSSAIGQHMLTKNILQNEFIATVVAVIWSGLLIMIYSYFRAAREQQYLLLAESFNYHRTLRADNRIGAIVKSFDDPASVEAPKAAKPPEPAKSEISKVEFVHSMEPMEKLSNLSKLPAEIRNDPKDKK
jgi:hypothetical protein